MKFPNIFSSIFNFEIDLKKVQHRSKIGPTTCSRSFALGGKARHFPPAPKLFTFCRLPRARSPIQSHSLITDNGRTSTSTAPSKTLHPHSAERFPRVHFPHVRSFWGRWCWKFSSSRRPTIHCRTLDWSGRVSGRARGRHSFQEGCERVKSVRSKKKKKCEKLCQQGRKIFRPFSRVCGSRNFGSRRPRNRGKLRGTTVREFWELEKLDRVSRAVFFSNLINLSLSFSTAFPGVEKLPNRVGLPQKGGKVWKFVLKSLPQKLRRKREIQFSRRRRKS